MNESSKPASRAERTTWIVLGGGLALSAALAIGLGIAGSSEPAIQPDAAPASGHAASAVGESVGKAAQLPQATLYEFEMESCAACDKMRPIVSEVESRCSHGEKIVQRIDIQAPAGEALAKQYNIRSVPTFVKVDHQGRVLERLTGVQPAEKLAAVVSGVTGKSCID